MPQRFRERVFRDEGLYYFKVDLDHPDQVEILQKEGTDRLDRIHEKIYPKEQGGVDPYSL